MMKTIISASSKILILLIVCIGFKSSLAQTLLKPEKVEIRDPLLVEIINDFIEDSQKNKAFYEDKGIIRINSCSVDSGSKTKYSLQVLIDNRYEDESVIRYAYHRNYVIVFDSCGYNPPIVNKEEYFKTLNYEIGNRVYQRPTNKERWVTYRSKEGAVVSGMKETHHLSGGGGSVNETVYIVDRYRSYKKFKAV